MREQGMARTGEEHTARPHHRSRRGGGLL
jgi:hypothetical protein